MRRRDRGIERGFVVAWVGRRDGGMLVEMEIDGGGSFSWLGNGVFWFALFVCGFLCLFLFICACIWCICDL